MILDPAPSPTPRVGSRMPVAQSALIADDEEDIRLLLRILLELSGIDVIGEAADGLEAVELYDPTDPPSVVILDERMPRMSGLETARRILACRRQQPIVLFSSAFSADVREEAAKLGLWCVSKTDYPSLPSVIGDACRLR